MMPSPKFFWILLLNLACIITLNAQRNYAAHSVLASGSWFKLGVTAAGVYKVDVNFLKTLGINTANLNSSSIRLYGNGGAMLPENNAQPRTDDLAENALDMEDGGDGIFNNNDYFLFYAPGPNTWVADSIHHSFAHLKNLYTDTAYYYLSVGGSGLRIQPAATPTASNVIVNSFDEHYSYENNLSNLLNSGKLWVGEAFSNNSGDISSRSFPVDFSGFISASPLTINSSVTGRSIGAPSGFSVSVNGQSVQQIPLPAVSGYFLDLYATLNTQSNTFTASSSPLTIGFQFNATASGAQGWLNWFEVLGRKTLSFQNSNLFFFRDWQSVAANNTASFSIANAPAATIVWDITKPLQPLLQKGVFSNNQYSFVQDASFLREYVAFTLAGTTTPLPLGPVANQDLHNSSRADLLLVTPPVFLQQAQQLANYHTKQDGLTVALVTTNQIYTEFASGNPDPSAIRDFIKMYYDKAGNNSSLLPKYVLLFGAATFDYKNRIKNNTNLVPGYESVNSNDPLSTYVSDDFYGLLKDSDDINNTTGNSALSIGIGRLPARVPAEAVAMAAKIIRYTSPASFGSWRVQSVFAADNGDQDLHVQDAEYLSAKAATLNPLFNQQKIYTDAYKMISGSGGTRFPDANTAIVNNINTGTLFFNYSGHGGYQQLSASAILTQAGLQQFSNPGKLPLFITATCDFAPYDDPTKNSLGGSLLYGDSTGAIALVTTTRDVYESSNKLINTQFIQTALQPGSGGHYPSLGNTILATKNQLYQSPNADVVNNRKFTLLGDPALTLAIPVNKVQVTAINHRSIAGTDTLQAMQLYTVSGKITDATGNSLTGFNGMVYPVVYDKPDTISTLGNDAASPPIPYSTQTNLLYKGAATVAGGQFSFSFIVPKDVNYQQGNGRMSLYAQNGVTDAAGIFTNFLVAGTDSTPLANTAGPQIKAWMNDTLFVKGGLTDENPVLLLRFFDSSGINTSQSSIGHDITAVLDQDQQQLVVLNPYYQSATDSYQQGSLSYPYFGLTEGPHSITIKAWDVLDHSATATLSFKVVPQKKLTLDNLFNYPNPFEQTTTISFQHNQPGVLLTIYLDIFNAAGQKVYTSGALQQQADAGNIQLEWNGTGVKGGKLQKGVYFYRIIVQSINGTVTAVQKLLLL